MIDSNVIHSKSQSFFNPTEYWIFKPDDIISDLDERVHPDTARRSDSSGTKIVLIVLVLLILPPSSIFALAML